MLMHGAVTCMHEKSDLRCINAESAVLLPVRRSDFPGGQLLAVYVRASHETELGETFPAS